MGSNRIVPVGFSPLLWFCLFTLIGYIIYTTKTFHFNDPEILSSCSYLRYHIPEDVP